MVSSTNNSNKNRILPKETNHRRQAIQAYLFWNSNLTVNTFFDGACAWCACETFQGRKILNLFPKLYRKSTIVIKINSRIWIATNHIGCRCLILSRHAQIRTDSLVHKKYPHSDAWCNCCLWKLNQMWIRAVWCAHERLRGFSGNLSQCISNLFTRKHVVAQPQSITDTFLSTESDIWIFKKNDKFLQQQMVITNVWANLASWKRNFLSPSLSAS